MLDVFSLVLPLFGLIFLGFAAGKLRKIPVDGLAWMNFFIVYLALPALFFQLLAKTPVSEFSNLKFLLLACSATFCIFLLCLIIARLVQRGLAEATVQGFAGAYGNIGYMGPPLAIAAFGPEAGVPVALIFCLENAIHFTVAPALMAFAGRRQQPNVYRIIIDIVRKILTHPFILATLAGMFAAWQQWQAPSAVEQILDSLAHAAAPCALFVMGLTAALRPLDRIPPELLYLVPIKLVIHPLLVYLFLSTIPELDPIWLHSAVLLAALPTATNVFVIAQQYHIWEQRASSTVVVSTAVSMLTVTAYLYLVT